MHAITAPTMVYGENSYNMGPPFDSYKLVQITTINRLHGAYDYSYMGLQTNKHHILGTPDSMFVSNFFKIMAHHISHGFFPCWVTLLGALGPQVPRRY